MSSKMETVPVAPEAPEKSLPTPPISRQSSAEAVNCSDPPALSEETNPPTFTAPSARAFHSIWSFGPWIQTMYSSDDSNCPQFQEGVDSKGNVVAVSFKYGNGYQIGIHHHGEREKDWEAAEERSFWMTRGRVEPGPMPWLRPRVQGKPETTGSLALESPQNRFSAYSCWSSRTQAFRSYGVLMDRDDGTECQFSLEIDGQQAFVGRLFGENISGFTEQIYFHTEEESQAFKAFDIPEAPSVPVFVLLLAYWQELRFQRRTSEDAATVHSALCGSWFATSLIPFHFILALYDVVMLRHEDSRYLPTWRRILRYAIFHANATLVDNSSIHFQQTASGARWVRVATKFIHLGASVFATVLGIVALTWRNPLAQVVCFLSYIVFLTAMGCMVFEGVREDVFTAEWPTEYFSFHMKELQKIIRCDCFKTSDLPWKASDESDKPLLCDCTKRPGSKWTKREKWSSRGVPDWLINFGSRYLKPQA